MHSEKEAFVMIYFARYFDGVCVYPPFHEVQKYNNWGYFQKMFINKLDSVVTTTHRYA